LFIEAEKEERSESMIWSSEALRCSLIPDTMTQRINGTLAGPILTKVYQEYVAFPFSIATCVPTATQSAAASFSGKTCTRA
jgi:hypothetical protein